jgi:hypothetical protein
VFAAIGSLLVRNPIGNKKNQEYDHQHGDNQRSVGETNCEVDERCYTKYRCDELEKFYSRSVPTNEIGPLGG